MMSVRVTKADSSPERHEESSASASLGSSQGIDREGSIENAWAREGRCGEPGVRPRKTGALRTAPFPRIRARYRRDRARPRRDDPTRSQCAAATKPRRRRPLNGSYAGAPHAWSRSSVRGRSASWSRTGKSLYSSFMVLPSLQTPEFRRSLPNSPNVAISPRRHKDTIGKIRIFRSSRRADAPWGGTEFLRETGQSVLAFGVVLCLGAWW